jgi:hypothetical protein
MGPQPPPAPHHPAPRRAICGPRVLHRFLGVRNGQSTRQNRSSFKFAPKRATFGIPTEINGRLSDSAPLHPELPTPPPKPEHAHQVKGAKRRSSSERRVEAAADIGNADSALRFRPQQTRPLPSPARIRGTARAGGATGWRSHGLAEPRAGGATGWRSYGLAEPRAGDRRACASVAQLQHDLAGQRSRLNPLVHRGDIIGCHHRQVGLQPAVEHPLLDLIEGTLWLGGILL